MNELVKLYLLEYASNKMSFADFEHMIGMKIDESDISDIKDEYQAIGKKVGKDDYCLINFDKDCQSLLNKYTDIILNK